MQLHNGLHTEDKLNLLEPVGFFIDGIIISKEFNS
jgi:hypothetical protein